MTAVEVRPEAARHLLDLLQAQLTRHVRNGGALPVWAPDLFRQLMQAAAIDFDGRFLSETRSGTVGHVGTAPGLVTTKVAAEQLGVSPQYLRRRASAGDIRSHRVSQRVWLIDLESARSVLRRSAA